MRSVFRHACALGCLLSLAVLPQSAQADIIFSNFSPANGAGYSSAAYSLAGAGSGFVYQSLATAFTPTQNYSLSAFQVAVRYLGGANSFRFSLVRDNGGSPTGASVVAPFASAIMGTGASGGAINSFAVSGTLLAGSTYWLVMEPGANDARGSWFQNSSGQTGGFNYANTPGSWLVSSLGTSAFRIDGISIPEPGSLALLALGAGAFLNVRRRRRS